MIRSDLYRNYRTRTFSEIFEKYSDFKDFYDTCGITPMIREAATTGTPARTNSLQNLYYLLLAKYANSPIASSDENRFCFRVMSIIFQYGPTWEKRLDVQQDLRAATLDSLSSTVQVYNQGQNPETAHSTLSTDGLEYINNQTVSFNKRNQLDAYMQYENLLKTDVTGEFLERFKTLFTTLPPESALWYITDTEEEEDDE